jgi:octopine/nopaline transport system permease protein
MTYFDYMGFGPRGWGGAMLFAALVTLAVSICALIVGAVIGTLVTWGKIRGPAWLRVAMDGYTTFIRGIPDLLVIYLFYFGGSIALTTIANSLGAQGFWGLPAFATGALAIGIISGAYQAEVYRGAYLAISRGELEAARAVGMSRFLMFRRIIAPQALRYAIPGLGNCWQLVLKESALVSVTGLVELMRQSQVGAGSTREPFYFYMTAAALYLVLTTLSTVLFDRAETYSNRGVRRA